MSGIPLFDHFVFFLSISVGIKLSAYPLSVVRFLRTWGSSDAHLLLLNFLNFVPSMGSVCNAYRDGNTE